MDAHRLRTLLEQLQSGALSLAEAQERLAALPFEELGFAKVDHHRSLRCGMPEVVFGANKTTADLLEIMERAARASGSVLATRLTDAHLRALTKRFPKVHVNARARTARLGEPEARASAPVAIVSAGTSDLPVAEEARETLAAFGCPSKAFYDVGVAGLHRLIHTLPELRAAPAVIAVAGMEGALPSVVGGLVKAPVIAVPTSVGYGASFGGVAALLGMLNTCAAGVTVVNIDNGFGAAAAALRILNLAAPARTPAPAVPHRGNGRRNARAVPTRRKQG
ncbi:MAG: nickel pincer cofactor biosynthesis protein LarB [Planctomycetota bacterium]|nr:nickel pincer cofactor biosynthesis protein LarB [Planctomycetota bacterium]